MSKPYVARGRKTSHNLTTEDKLNAIQRIQNGETKASVSREIGVPESTLRGWCKRALRDKLPHLQQPNAGIATDTVPVGNDIANNYGTTNTWFNGQPNSNPFIGETMFNDPKFMSMVSKVQHHYEQLHSVSKYMEAQRIQQQYEEMQQQQMQKLMQQQEQLHLEHLRREQLRQDNVKRQEILLQLFTPQGNHTPDEQQITMTLVEGLVRPPPPPLVKETTGSFPLVEFLAKLVDVTFVSKGHELRTNMGEIVKSYDSMLQARDKVINLRHSELSQEVGNLRHICKLLNEFLITGNEEVVKENIKNFIKTIAAQKKASDSQPNDHTVRPKKPHMNYFVSDNINTEKEVVTKVDDEEINSKQGEDFPAMHTNVGFLDPEKSYNSDDSDNDPENLLYYDDSDSDWDDLEDVDDDKTTESKNICKISSTVLKGDDLQGDIDEIHYNSPEQSK